MIYFIVDVELEKTVTKRKWQRVKTYEDEDLAAIYRAQGMGFKVSRSLLPYYHNYLFMPSGLLSQLCGLVHF